MHKIVHFIFLSLILMGYNQEITGECCAKYIYAVYFCNLSICSLEICADGTSPTPYCAYGKCDWFGCLCEGGCRRGVSEEDAIRIFKEANPEIQFVDSNVF